MEDVLGRQSALRSIDVLRHERFRRFAAIILCNKTMRATSVLSEKFRLLRMHVRHIPSVLVLSFSAAGKWTIAWMVLVALQGLLPVASIYLTGSLVDILAGPGQGHPAPRSAAIELACLLSGIYLLGELLRGTIAWVRSAQADLVQDHLNQLIHRKSAEVDI